MFCRNCGKEIPENTKFCNHCGAAQDSAPAQTTSQPVIPQKPKKGLKIGGIVLTVCGALSVVGSFANESYFKMLNYGMDSSDAVTIGFQIGLIVGGIVMICKSAKGK